MIYLWIILVCVCITSTLSYAQQFYDSSDCSSDSNSSYPGSRYTCKPYHISTSCHTFLVYRANQHFNSFAKVSELFHINANDETLLHLNNLTSPSEILKSGREVLVPITCSCSGQFFQANFSYIVSENSTTLSEIACDVFEGLLKSFVLIEENHSQENDVNAGAKLHVTLRCACPDNFTSNIGVKYLVTYPLVEGDVLSVLSKKFGITPPDIWAANHLESPKPTVFPNTTILIPLKSDPEIDFNVSDDQPPSPGFLPTITVGRTEDTKLRNSYIAGSVVSFFLVIVVLLVCGLYVKKLNRSKAERLQSFNTRSSPLSCSTPRCLTPRSSPRSNQTSRSSTNSCLSPDLLVGIKYSLQNYSIEDLRRATKDFSEGTKISDQVYKGLLDNVEVMIKQMRFEDTRQVIDVHSKINHKNIVNLQGVCYGEDNFSCSFLMFEFPRNGCLRDCLLDSANPLRWNNRTQIAFDVATALHYLHHCIFPSYAHMSVNSRNIFLTSDWRAKLANINTINTVSVKGWIASEYIVNGGTASEKADIFAFGVVLLELLSGRADIDGNFFKDSIGFLGGGANEGGCFDQLRSFLDPALNMDYSLAEALCLAVLAKACVEDDPLHRPSMDDIMKVLARMV